MSVQQAVLAHPHSTFGLKMPPFTDTVRISVALLQPKDTCLSSLIGAGRTITSYNACQAGSRHIRLTAQSADCVRLTAISTATGSQDTLCIQHCNRNGTDCRTFVLIAQVANGTLSCDIAPDTLMRVQLADCQSRARFCIPGSNILDEFRRNYTVTHNGLPYSGTLDGCSFDTIYSYTYFTVPGMFQQPPYRLDTWMFNGVNRQIDSVNTIFELVDSMNQWDPRSLWTLDTASLSIIGGYPGNAGTYGELRMTKLSNGASGVMRVNTSQVSNGVSLNFGTGQHIVVFRNNVSNCSDTLRMGVGCTGLLPIAVDDSVVTRRNTPITFNLLSNDLLNGSLARPPGIITLSTTGTITVSLTPTSANVTYIPRTGFCGTEVFEYQICNSEGCDTAKVTINVICDSTGSRKPIAMNDIAQTRQNNSLIINILQNDSLHGNLSEPLRIIAATRRGNAIVSNNSIRFTPSRNFCGFDTLQYQICNAQGCDSAMVFITVICDSVIDTRKPIANNDNVQLQRNTSLLINVLQNDSLYGGLSEPLAIIAGARHGNAIINNNQISYTPSNNFCGGDTLQYQICNLNGCDTGRVVMTVTCDTVVQTRKPIAVNDVVFGRRNTSWEINALRNDTLFGNLVSFEIITNPAHGQAVTNNRNFISYVSAIDFCGSDTLRYRVCNAFGCDTAMIHIVITCDTITDLRKPKAVNDTVTVRKNNTLTFNALWNDSIYIRLNAFNFVQGGLARHGSATINDSNQIVYRPALDYCGMDTLIYKICNDNGCDTARVCISVICDTIVNNRKPNAINDFATVARNSDLTLNVLRNDSIYGALVAPINIVQTANHGVATVNNNQISYIPTTGYCGNDTLSYAICNVNGCDSAFVYITVTCDTIVNNRKPNAVNDFATVARNTNLTMNALQNDTLFGGLVAPMRIVQLANHGVATVENNQISYIPTAGYCGNDTLSYSICNANGCDSAFVSITVTCDTIVNNRKPNAVNDFATVARNTNLMINALQNDTLFGVLVAPMRIVQLANHGVATVTNNQISYIPTTSYCGNDTLSYSICNANGCDSAFVYIAIICDTIVNNRKPNAVNDFATVARNNNLMINALQNDTLFGALVAPMRIVQLANHGVATIANNQISYISTTSYCGNDTLSYSICNANGCDSAFVYIAITCDTIVNNRKPNAVNDFATVARNSDLTLNVLRNDSIYGALIAPINIVQAANHGVAIVNNNQISYIPTTGYCGNDTLSYSICNTNGCDSAFVYITVTCDTIANNRKPNAVADFGTVARNNNLIINVLQNDTIHGALIAPVSIVGTARHGGATLSNNQISYTPVTNYCGNDTLSYAICNVNGCDTAFVYVSVTCDTIVSNRRPDAVNDNVLVNRNNSLEINALRNDSLHGALTAFELLDTARHGRAVVANDRIFYTPTTNYCGNDTFRYKICNVNGCDTAFIFVNVNCDTVVSNRRPNAVNDVATTNRNNSLTINILQNDSLHGVLTSLAILDSTRHGNALVVNNQIRYTPLNGFCGNDTLTYKVCNANGCDTASVFITISCDTIANHRPDANDDSVIARRNTPLQINPLQNDSLYGMRMNFGIARLPRFGRVVADSTQIFYAPLAEYCGLDTIQYFVCNLHGCDTATIFINVNCDTARSVPEANNDIVTTPRNTLLIINALANDVTHGQLTSTLRVPELPRHGTVVVNANNSIDYTPTTGYCGKDTLRYEICNAAGCDSAFVFITVTCDTVINSSFPNANPDFGFGIRQNPLTINILRNDTIRGNQDSLRLTQLPRHGSATIRFNNLLVYTPDSTFCGKDTMIYKLCNQFGCDTAMVVATIECDTTLPCSIAPVAMVDGININQRQSAQIFILRNDSLKNCLLDSFYILIPAQHGSASADMVDKVIQYTPLPDYCGKDSLVYKICNAQGCDTAIVYINIRCDSVVNNNLLPIANRDDIYGARAIPLAIMVLRNDSTHGRVTMTLERQASAGRTQIVFGNLIQYTPNNLFCGTDTIIYKICNTNGCDTGLVVIHIACDTTSACSVPPVAYFDTASTRKGRGVTILVIANDSLKNCRPDSLVISQRPLHGVATTDILTQIVRYQPDTSYCGTDTLVYKLCNQAGCDTALVIIRINCDSGLTTLLSPIALRDDIVGFRDSTLNIYVIRNDTVNGTLDSFRITRFPAHGQASITGVDYMTYQPNAGFCGFDTVIYKICNRNSCDTALVVISISCDTIRACSVPPVANFDTISTLKGVTATIRAMANDSLRNCAADTLRIERQPRHGVATADLVTQIIVYQPDTSYCGKDTLIYTLCNRVGCDTALIIITVNCARDSNLLNPIAVRDDASGILNTSVAINVLRNDTINGHLDSLEIQTRPRHGRATRSIVTNAIYYQPDSAFCGRDTFIYKVCNQFGCDTALVVVTISCDTTRPCSEPPVALKDSARTPVNRAVEIRVLANDSLKNCPLDSLTITKKPLHGIVQVDSIDKVVTYEPFPNYCGRDTFRYQICNIMGCDTATVIVVTSCDTVGLPIANNDTLRVRKDSTLIFSALANDSINGTFRTLSIIKNPGHGTASNTSDGQISYRPAPSFCGKDSLVYELCNQIGCDTAKVFFKVSCGDTIIIYTGFSPNHDGKNDFLVLEGIEDFPNHEVRIFNRWGTEVFFTKNYQNHYSGGFEGQWNGKDLPDGVYFIRVDNGKTGVEHEVIMKYIMIMR
jgi:large repetitive protein